MFAPNAFLKSISVGGGLKFQQVSMGQKYEQGCPCWANAHLNYQFKRWTICQDGLFVMTANVYSGRKCRVVCAMIG